MTDHDLQLKACALRRAMLQIILEVTDNGTPPLTGYQRVLCTIK